MSYLFNNNTVLDGASTDAFGRLRVSDAYTLFDSQLQNDKAPALWAESVVGTGASSTHLPNEAAVRMRVGTAVGEKVIRQSRIFTRYQPGKSHLVLMTGIMGTPKAGVRQRIGYFDDTNGLFFECKNGTLSIVKRTSTSGSPVDIGVSQSNWNIDKLDGNGKSRIALDITKTLIFIIDFQWLGVGRVRMGFVINGDIIYCHEFLHANAMTEVYISHANLPCRYEIENIAASASYTDMKQICANVSSEGGFDPRGYLRHDGLTTPKNIGTTMIPIFSVRPKALYKGTWFEPTNYQFINTSNSFVYYQVLLSPTLTGANWRDAQSTNFSEVDSSATTFTGGVVLFGGYLNSKDNYISDLTNNIPVIGTNLDGSRDHITVAMQSISGSANVLCSINWKEVR